MVYLFLFCIFYYLMAGISVGIGYHRFLSHHSFKLKKWFEYFIITTGLPAGTPIQWAGNHRYHHAHTDMEKDPHSPVVNGFWYAHNGWYINSRNSFVCFLYALAGPVRFIIDSWNRPRTNQQFNYLAPEIAADPYYHFISKPVPYMFALWLHFILPFGMAYYFWGLTGFFSMWLTLVLVFNFGDAIDSVAHLYGEQPYKKKDHARNNWFMAIVTLGDGWHADHHQFPGSARLGLKPGRFDCSWHIISMLKFFRIAYDVNNISYEKVVTQLKNNTSL